MLQHRMSGRHRLMFLTAMIGALGTGLFAASMYGDLPDEVPIHFNLSGEADRWGPKGFIFVAPTIMAVIIGVLYAVALFNTDTTSNGKTLTESGHRTVIRLMRTMSGLLALCMAILAWEATLAISMRVDGAVMAVVTVIALIAVTVIYSTRMLLVTKRDPGSDR